MFGLSFAKLLCNRIFVLGQRKEFSVEHAEKNVVILRYKRLESSYSWLSVSVSVPLSPSLTSFKCVC